ncbi:MAG: HAMP domain-containing protein, partial [Nitrospirae bacterium]
MRTKLFLSFLLIILLALLSNLVFEKLIINDFDEYVKGNNEDRIYWVMASVEGSYKEGRWDEVSLRDSIHWAMMLGFETYITDLKGKTIITTSDVLAHLSATMLRRMASLFELPTGYGDFIWYPLFVEGKEIGKIYFRPLKRRGYLPRKEEIFRKRGRQFLLITFAIAGGGALFLSLAFSFFLSRPLKELTLAAEKVAEGDFSSRVSLRENRFWRLFAKKDEIDRLSESFNFMVTALQKEDTLRKHLTTNIAHELRTPLTVVKGNLEAIEDGIVKDVNQALKGIKREIDRIIELIQGIEDLTQAEASFFKKGKKVEIDLYDFIKETLSAYEHP